MTSQSQRQCQSSNLLLLFKFWGGKPLQSLNNKLLDWHWLRLWLWLVTDFDAPKSDMKVNEKLLDWHWLRTKEITTYCPNSRTRTRLENAMHLIEQDHIKIKELVTHEIDFCDVPDVYQMLLEPSEDFLGIIINWKIGR